MELPGKAKPIMSETVSVTVVPLKQIREFRRLTHKDLYLFLLVGTSESVDTLSWDARVIASRIVSTGAITLNS
jgi:hypothetical protein